MSAPPGQDQGAPSQDEGRAEEHAPADASQAPPPPPAPGGWTEHTAPDGRLYYYNAATQQSTWDRPAELGPIEMSPEAMMQAQMAMMYLGGQMGMGYFPGYGSPVGMSPMAGMPGMPGMMGGFSPDGSPMAAAAAAAAAANAAAVASAVAAGYGSPSSPGGGGAPGSPGVGGGGGYPGYGDMALATGGYIPEMVGPGPPIQTTADTQGPDGANAFVFHIPNDMTNLELYDMFAVFGNVISARIMIERDTGRSRGFGFVSFDDPAACTTAIQSMDGYQIGRKRLKVQLKKERGAPADHDAPRERRGSGSGRGGHRRGRRRSSSGSVHSDTSSPTSSSPAAATPAAAPAPAAAQPE